MTQQTTQPEIGYGLKYDLTVQLLTKLGMPTAEQVAAGERFTKLERAAAEQVLSTRKPCPACREIGVQRCPLHRPPTTA